MIKIPKLLQSLVALSRFKVGTHLREEIDQQNLEVRNKCRWCLRYIQECCDEQVQSELVNNRYGRVLSITFSTAGGKGEEQDEEIENGLECIKYFLIGLHTGRTYRQPSFQPLPLLVRRSEEQIEEEGANEEIEAQLNDNGYDGDIKYYANDAKAVTLNHFIHGG
ncbi:MAG: hypothetical protein EZS28_053681 [Streblomastix strix]|uniref:Uncharacterized protein n=1 Tax=Streblomastix strix TaxID=222440 RepID=A0A5J4R6L8_9EUKA|nr:MAG: hypothetical protein EZS28_053681 [Streblomastix strix]